MRGIRRKEKAIEDRPKNDPPRDVAFRCFRQFNRPETARMARGKWRLTEKHCELFPGEDLNSKMAREICLSESMRLKEVLESFEFYYRVKRQIRAAHIWELCAGHGLTGLLFAALERRVVTVRLVDSTPPPLFERLFEGVCRVAPWVKEKVGYVVDKMDRIETPLAGDSAVVAVHACGVRTDRALDLAIAQKKNIAVMPCCHNKGSVPGLPAIQTGLSPEDASDVHRTYRLEAAGYSVRWSAIPAAVTAKNRIIVAQRR